MPSQDESQSIPTSPLAQVNPRSLDELFSRDPLDLAQTDIDTIIGELRRQREVWVKLEAQGARNAKGGAKKQAAPPGLDLNDLGL